MTHFCASQSEKCEEICFSPPLYRQRYLKIIQFIQDYGNGSFSKVVDIGCSQLALFQYLTRMQGVKEVVLMDIDQEVLKSSCHRVDPLPIDIIHRREDPLSVTVICGDAKFAHYPTLNADVVTMIEFIEHLYEDDLTLVVKNVFGIMCPKLVIITTPNYDFNQFFPDLPRGGFRHFDHKFEWTKSEFENWCKRVNEEFPQYEVTFSGCGKRPNTDKFCSQIGIFYRNNETLSLEGLENKFERNLDCKSILEVTRDPGNCNSAAKPCEGCLSSRICKVIHKVEYPFDDRTTDEKFRDNVLSSLSSLRLGLKEFLNSWDLNGDVEISNQHPHPPWEQLKEKDSSGNKTTEQIVKDESDPTHYSEEDHLLKQKCETFISFSNPKVDDDDDEEEEETNGYHGDEELSLFFSSSSDEDSFYLATSEGANTPSDNGKTSVATGSSENEALKFKLILSSDWQLENEENASMENAFFYFEIENTFLFRIDTFCAWANLNSEDKVRNVLREAGVTLREINSNHLITLSFMEEEESSCGESEE